MDNQLSPEKLAFDLFVDAVKRKDKMQFAYFNLYFEIKNANESKQKDFSKNAQDFGQNKRKSETEELTL